MNERINPHFYNFLAEGNIICGLASDNSRGVINELAEKICRNTAGLDSGKVADAVFAREKMVPTVIAPGLAVPHARMADVDKLLIALGTSVSGVDFNCPGMPPVRVAIMILTPKDDPGLHLQVLAALARDFQDPESIEQIVSLRTPADVMRHFSSANVQIPDYLKARDVMNPEPVTLLESDTLHTAIDTFAKTNALDIPLLDDDGDLRGVVSLEDILKFSLPDHILWMDDLTPIYRFQPFSAMLRDDQETKLADFMREDMVVVDQDIPAIQLAKIFLMDRQRQIIVTSGGKLAGVVNLKNFISKLFWE